MNRRPNILFINVDQLRYDSLGVTGNPIVRTPNIDRIARRGVSFSRAYTPLPSCCPARQSLLTGMMPEKHAGIWNFGGGGSLPVPEIKPRDSRWVPALREAGYRTAYIGKWHAHPELDPTRFGFESYDDAPNDNYDTPHKAEKHAVDNPWPEFPIGHYETLPVEECHTHALAKICLDKIDELGASGEPWHIRLDHSEPHLPCVPAEPYASMYPPETIPPWENFADDFAGKPYIQKQQLRNWCLENWTWKEWSVYMSGYYGIISQLDDALGMVLDHLEDKGLMENTLIVFTTDHGDAAGSHRQIDKHYVMYEEEAHVPLFMRWDGVLESGVERDDFVSHFLDLPATILDLLGLSRPEGFQGLSLLPALKGDPARRRRNFAFSSYNGQQFGLYCQRMIRDERFKYVWNATDVDELYDLENDPFEMKNLAAADEDSQLCRTYRKHVHEVFAELEDPLVTGLWNARYLTGEKQGASPVIEAASDSD